MAIKKIDSETKYSEVHINHRFEVNGKIVKVFEFQKQDELFSDYESEFEFEKPNDLTDEEMEEIEEILTN